MSIHLYHQWPLKNDVQIFKNNQANHATGSVSFLCLPHPYNLTLNFAFMYNNLQGMPLLVIPIKATRGVRNRDYHTLQ